ncbi:MAG: 50S ribosomal protein L37ae [Candidatus Woesearchaeota archaeon]|jgi:large subunit ribosomal protein L37Ae|nr:50S ribosomal protein L37ae [archaeon]MDP6548064.1 50S ribosomal protein L37ae [Candidatus Woesearchaeota archaeon]MDP7263040.1 50S ribosomal protein L37ae [Candidatus Woesearchaeota archaeon]MDP7622729.1 50S ribosomal protein L37ae [Candidatus Woesearchaeota archaeon]HJN57070.1 50S ribosomal protein L37ae [Candidatus Woesearchaeota archaeon]|tara:strand:- start:6334 stop:6711 length:378 start_codon:yes stop_codon:yes gene_type:complete
MAKVEKLSSAKRFGARYGSKPKHKFAKIEKEQRKKHKCPYCNKVQVKRVAMGIWHCRKCNSKFTGKAYSISKQIAAEDQQAEESQVEKPQVEEDQQTEEKQEDIEEQQIEKQKAEKSEENLVQNG